MTASRDSSVVANATHLNIDPERIVVAGETGLPEMVGTA